MAPIKHWCISPASQREQKPTHFTCHSFICFLSLCPKGSLVWAAIKFPGNVKTKRPCHPAPAHMRMTLLTSDAYMDCASILGMWFECRYIIWTWNGCPWHAFFSPKLTVSLFDTKTFFSFHSVAAAQMSSHDLPVPITTEPSPTEPTQYVEEKPWDAVESFGEKKLNSGPFFFIHGYSVFRSCQFIMTFHSAGPSKC